MWADRYAVLALVFFTLLLVIQRLVAQDPRWIRARFGTDVGVGGWPSTQVSDDHLLVAYQDARGHGFRRLVGEAEQALAGAGMFVAIIGVTDAAALQGAMVGRDNAMAPGGGGSERPAL